MTQLMVKLHNLKSVGVQTGDSTELYITLTNKKTARVYYSSAYKEKVLSINFGTSKNFIFTKDMWNKFKKHFSKIDAILNE